MSSNLPLVGAHAVLLGVNAFQQNARSIIFQLNEVNAVTSKLGRDAERSYTAAASAAQRHANVVTAQATRAITSYGQLAKSAQDSAKAEAAANQQALASLGAHGAALIKHREAQANVARATTDLANAQTKLNAVIEAGASARQIGFAQGAINIARKQVDEAVASESKLAEAVLKTNLVRQQAAARASALMSVYGREKAAQQDLVTATNAYVTVQTQAASALIRHRAAVDAQSKALIAMKAAQAEATLAAKAAAAVSVPTGNINAIPPSQRAGAAAANVAAQQAAQRAASQRAFSTGNVADVLQAEQGIAVAVATKTAAELASLQKQITSAQKAESAARSALVHAEHDVAVAKATQAAARQAAAFAIISAGAAQFNSILASLAANMAAFVAASQRAAVVLSGVFGVAVAALVGLGVGSAKVAATYQESLTSIQAITEGTRPQMEALDAAIEKIGTTTRISMKAAAEASGELAKGGVDLTKQLEGGALKAVTDLAQASRGELTPALAAVAVAVGLNAFQFTNATEIANAMVATVQSSAITFSDLKISLQQAALVAGGLNYTLPDTIAAIGLLGEVGLRGSDAGTSLRSALQHLQKPSQKAKEEMNKYGLSLYEANGNARPLRDVLSSLEKAFGKQAIANKEVTIAQRNFALQTIFSTDGARSMLALIGQGVGKFDEFRAAQERLTAAELANKYMLPLNAQFDLFGNNVQRVATRLGEGLIPVLGPVIGGFSEMLANIPTEAFYLFGQSIAALINDTGFGELNEKIRSVFGEDVAPRIIAFIEMLRDIGTAISSHVLPALSTLAELITKPFTETDGVDKFVQLTRDVANGFNTAAVFVGGFINAVANIIRRVQESERAVAAFLTVVKGLVAIPLIGLVTIFGGIALAIAKVVAVALLVGSIINNWTSIEPIIGGIAGVISSNLVPILAVAAAAMIAFGVTSMLLAIGNMIVMVTTAAGVVKSLALVAAAGFTAAKGIAVIALSALTTAASTIGSMAKIAGSFVLTATVAVRSAALAALAWASHLPRSLALSAASVNAAMITMSVAFRNVMVAAVLSATTIIKVWTGAVARAIGVAVAAILANFGAILIIVGLVAAAAFVLQKTWKDNMDGMYTTTNRVVLAIANTFARLVDFLANLPGMEQIMPEFAQAVRVAGYDIRNTLLLIEKNFKDMTEGITLIGDDGSAAINALIAEANTLIETMQTPLPEFELPEMGGELFDLRGWLDELAALNAELTKAAQKTDETVAGNNDFGDSGEDAAKKYAAALKILLELFEDTNRKLENIAEDTAEKIALAAKKHQDAWIEAHEEAATAIKEVYENAAQQIEDMWADLDFSRGQRKQKEGLADIIDDARRARERAREDTERIEDKSLDDVRRARQEANEALEREYQEDVENKERASNRAVQIEEAAQRKINEAVSAGIQKRQDAESRALSERFDAVNRSRSTARDEAKAQQSALRDRARLNADFARDSAKAKTQAERQELHERFNERLAELNAAQQQDAQDRAQRRSEEEADAAIRRQQEAEERALKAAHDQEQREEKERQDTEDMQRRFGQEDTEYERRKANDKAFRDWKKKQDDTERTLREKEDNDLAAKRRARDDNEREDRLAEDKRMRALEDQLEEDSIKRRADAINAEAAKRVTAINDALIKKQAAIDAQLKEELAAIQRSLSDQLRALRQQWLDKMPEIIEQGGEKIRPLVDAMFDQFITRSEAFDAVLQQIIDDLKEAVGLQNTLNEEKPEDKSSKTKPPAGTQGGLTGSTLSFQRGGKIPGLFGTPMLIRAHAGEHVIGLQASRALMAAEHRAAVAGNMMTNNINNTYQYEYNVAAQYSREQSPSSVDQDLRALIALVRQ